MVVAAVDTVGYLPAPVTRSNKAAGDILEGQLFAFGSASGVVVVEVHKLQVACVLQGVHRSSTVTSVKWCPDSHSRNVKQFNHLRLASGDSDGNVVVWDVLTATPVAQLEELLRDGKEGKGRNDWGPVQDLAWVLPSTMLLVLLAPAQLILWDVKGRRLLWQKDLSNCVSEKEVLSSIAVDPLDCRHVALMGSQGSLVVMHVKEVDGKLNLKQYRVNLEGSTDRHDKGSSPTVFQAMFATTRDLLFLLLSHELLVFDLELGQPAASKALPPDKAPFSTLLAVYGSGASQGTGDDGGVDWVYCIHTDARLSIWVRTPGHLKYSNSTTARLVPPTHKGSAMQNLSIVCARAFISKLQDEIPADSLQFHTRKDELEDVTNFLKGSVLGESRSTHVQRDKDGKHKGQAGAEGQKDDPHQQLSADSSLLLMTVTADGRVWQWESPIPRFPDRSFIATSTIDLSRSTTHPVNQSLALLSTPKAVPPTLIGLLHGLSSSVSMFSMYPRPVVVPGSRDPNNREVVILGAAATTQGSVDIVTIHRGPINPFSIDVTASLAIHRDVVIRGIRWLGLSSRIVAFSCEKSSSGFRNTLILTDVRTRRSTQFRDLPVEQAEMVGLRASPSGSYVLVLLKGAPSELWAVGGSGRPFRVRLVDLPFTAVEWVLPADYGQTVTDTTAYSSWAQWSASGQPDELPKSVAPQAAFTPEKDTSAAPKSLPGRPRTLSLSRTNPATDVLSIMKSPSLGSNSGLGSVAGPAGDLATALANATGAPAAEPPAADQRPMGNLTSLTSFSSFNMEGLGVPGLRTPPKPPHSPPPEQVQPQKTPQTQALQSQAQQELEALPEEFMAFTLGDGRAGVLSVKGRKVADTRARKPSSGVLSSLDMQATAMVAMGILVILGDAEGNLTSWDTSTGACVVTPTPHGMIRRIQISAPPYQQLQPAGQPLNASKAQLAVLFSSGAFAVYTVDSHNNRIRSSPASIPACAKVGKVVDLCWLPTPPPVGSGSILCVVLEDGSLSVLDVVQAVEDIPSQLRRHLKLKQYIATKAAGDLFSAPVQLAPPKTLGATRLLRLAWTQLLRLILQLGISQEILLAIQSKKTEDEDDVRESLLSLLPRSARRALLSLVPVKDDEVAASGEDSEGFDALPSPSSDFTSSVAGPLSARGGAAKSSAPSTPHSGFIKGLKVSLWGGRRAKDVSSSPSTQDITNESLHGTSLMEPLDVEPGDLTGLLRLMAERRSAGHLLYPDEWSMYTKALASGSVAERMEVAAVVAGASREARFWRHLPATLKAVKPLVDHVASVRQSLKVTTDFGDSLSPAPASLTIERRVNSRGQDTEETHNETPSHMTSRGESDGQGGGERGSVGERERYNGLEPIHTSSPVLDGKTLSRKKSESQKVQGGGRTIKLWDENFTLADAQERARWHEHMNRCIFETEQLQERRVLEYVVLGDFQTTVAFLLASKPDRTVPYYRDALCTMALAASCNNKGKASVLHVQAAKVVAANAATIGDTLLGIPLHCSAGLYAEAVTILQEVGLWRYAANLVANSLEGAERALALQRWAQHVLSKEGCVWRAVGILTAAGCLRAALQVLRQAELFDCALAYLQACHEHGLLLPVNFFDNKSKNQEAPERALSLEGSAVFIAPGVPQGQLFDMLEDNGQILPNMVHKRPLGGDGDSARGEIADDSTLVRAEFEQYCVELVMSL